MERIITDTIIDGNGIGHVIEINADNVTLEGFTVQHSGPIEEFKFDAGVSHNLYVRLCNYYR